MTSSHRSFRRLSVAVIVASLALPLAGPVAAAGWTNESLTDGWFLTRPSLAIESDDAIDIVYERDGTDPGLFFTTNATGSFVDQRLTSGSHWAADFVLDPADRGHVAYTSYGADAGIHYLTNESGSWVDARLTTGPEDGEPAIALDAAGKVHIVYPASGLDPGIFYLTNESGTWLKTRLVSATHDLSPDIAIDAAGTVHVIMARFAPEAPGLYYTTRTTGTWSAPVRVTASYDDWPALAVDAAGKAHVAFQRFGTLPTDGSRGELHVGTNAAGSWAFERLPGAYPDFVMGPPDVGFDDAGAFHVVVRESSRDQSLNPVLRHHTQSAGVWTFEDIPGYVFGADVEFPTFGISSNGVIHVGYRSVGGVWAGIFLSTVSSYQGVASSQDDQDPSIASATDGTRHVAFDRANANIFVQGVHYGDEAGGWDFSRVQWGVSQSDVSSGATDLALAPDGSARIGIREPNADLLTNQNGPWERASFCCPGTGGALAVDGNGKSHLAITQGTLVRYATDADGAWGSIDLYSIGNSGDAFVDPAIAVDGLGRRHVLFVYQTPTFTPGLMYMTAAAGSAWPSTPTRLYAGVQASPDAVVDGANKLHVAWIDRGSSPGIYYATNATGAWVRTRLSRSTADGPPSIAVDPNGKILVAFARGYWAATPGMYLVTNRSGSWQTSRISDDDGAGNPSLDVGPDGLADIAYVSNVDGVSILAESATAIMRVIRSARSEADVTGYLRSLDGRGADTIGSTQGTRSSSKPSSSSTDSERSGAGGAGFRSTP